MVLNTEWAQVEVIDLINDGSGLAFGIIGGRSTGVVVKTILPGGVADRDGRLQSGDHILQIGEVNLRGLGSEQVASVLRQCGVHVRMVVARPVESGSSEYQGISSHAPIVPTKILGDPVELDRHLIENGYAETFAAPHPSNNTFGNATTTTPFIYSGQQTDLMQMHPISGIVDVVRDPKPIGPVTISNLQQQPQQLISAIPVDVTLKDPNLPETECYTVTLRKDDLGLGITVAGYVCEKEEISGIFVKSISKGSAADLTGRIKVNDRIVEVDGRSIIGQSNHQAVECLRNTDATVTIRFERYLRGPKFEQLQQAIRANELKQPTTPPSPSSVSTLPKIPFSQVQMSSLTIEPELESRTSFDFDSAVLLESMTPTNENQEIVIGGGPAIEQLSHEAVYEKWKALLPEDAEIVMAQLEKGTDSGLGISLEGTVDVEDGQEVRPHHYIRNILPDGPVGRNGVLRSGDELLEVNGIRLMGLNHLEVVSTLKQLPSAVRIICSRTPIVTRIIDTAQHKEAFKARNILADSLQTIICNNRDQLVKAKSETSLASSALSDMCSAPCSSRSRSLDLVAGFPMWSDEPVVVELIKADHGLGFSILDYQDPMNPQETVIVIRSLVPGGVAQTDGRLIPGDRVIAVNGIDIEHATLDRAVKVLKGVSKGTVTITVVKPLSTNDSAMHNSQDTDQDEQTCLDEFQECLEEYQECLEVVQICLDGDNAFELSIDDDDDDELIRSSSINNNNNNQHNQEQHHNKNNNNNSSSNNNNNNLTSNNSKVTVNNNNKLVSESEPELSYKSVCDEEEEAVVVEDVEKRVNCTTENCKLDPASSTSLLIKKCQNNSNSNSCSSSGGVGSFVVKTKQTDSVAVETGQKLPNEEPSSDKTDGYETCIDESFSEDAVCAKIKLQNDDDDKADDDQIGETRGDVEEDRFDGDANKTPTNSAEDLLGDRFPANVASTDLDERGAEQPSTTDAIVRLTSADEDDYLKCYDDRADDIGEDDDNQDVSLDTDEFFLIDYDRTRSRSSKSDVVSIKSSSEPNVHRPFFYRKRLDEYYNDYADCLDSYIVDARDNVVDGGGETECERVVARVKDGASLTGGKSSGTRLNGKSSSAPDILDKSFVMLTYDPGPQKNLRRRRSALDPTFTATNCVEMMRESLPMTVSKKEPNRRSLADARETDVDNMLQKHWGSIRTVRIFKEPNTSLGISIVGGKVDLYNSSSPGTETILGIFVKNVVPDSPAGRTGQLKTGDRILEVSGVQLRNASHERAVEAIRNAPNPVTFLVQSLIPWSIDNNNEHETSASSRYATNNCSSPYPSPVSFGANEQCGPATSGDRKDSRKGKKLTHRQGETIVEGRENVDLARLQGTCCNDLDTVTRFDDGGGVDEGRDSNKKITTSNTSILPNDDNINKITASSTRITATATTAATTTTKSIESSEESDDDEEDVRELEGRTVSAKGHEIDRASAANIKRTKEEISADPEEEDDFGYTINKVKKKYANLGHTILMVQLERSGQGLGLSLAGHKDRNCMAVFVCGLNPMGVAFKTGGIQVGDEILEVNGVVLHGRCHLNASAIIKGLSGPIFKVIILRRKTAIDDIAVKPITQFPVSLAEETSEEAFSNYPNVRTVSIKKGTQSLGIMIIEGKHAEVGQGIFISDLQEGSAAEKAGLEIGEMILAVNKDSLLGSNYDNAANLLKRTEGLVRLVVSNPGKKPGTPTAGDEKIGLKAAGPPTRPTTPVPEPPADPATCPIKSGKETTIEINSDNKPLGVFFVGGKDTQTTGGIVVVEVHGNGMAEKDNRLQSGDQILDVNGTTLKDVTYNGALQALRQTLPKMKLIVYRPEKIDYQDIDVEFVKKPGKGLGLSVVGRKAGKGVYVGDVLNGGPADIDGKISRGDLIVSVNGQSIENATAEEAAAVLKTATGKVAIKLHRYKPAAR